MIEDKGVIPPTIFGLKFISITHFSSDNPSPFRGIDISNAIIEILAITRWGQLDYLIIDSPPGIWDAALDTIRLIKKVEFFIVTTLSKLAFETVMKMVSLLGELKVPIIGVVKNLVQKFSSNIDIQLRSFNVPILGEIRFDKNVEECIGNIEKLVNTNFAHELETVILEYIISKK
jgi:ATP-binding protein involved in chromosome partitioning